MIDRNHKLRQTFIKLLCMLWCLIACLPLVTGNNNTKSARTVKMNMFPKSKYISFNTLGDSIGIDLDLSIPFLSIPLERGYGSTQSLININAKALTIAGIFTLVSTIFVPLLSRPQSTSNYRSNDADDSRWYDGESINQFLLDNSYLGPCTKKFICLVVSKACHRKGQKSIDKIIDGISSHEWVEQMVKGTPIEEAITAGRKSEDTCNLVYSGCFLSKKLFESFPDLRNAS